MNKKSTELCGQYVRLRPVDRNDYEWLYRISLSHDAGFRWRYKGMTPGPEEFVHNLWRGVLCQFVPEIIGSGKPVGLVTAFDANHQDGWAHLGVISTPETRGTGLAVEGVGLLIDYLFKMFRFRKIYFSTLDYNLEQFESELGKVATREGLLREHSFFDGRYWDMHVFAISGLNWSGFRNEKSQVVEKNLSSVNKDSFADKVLTFDEFVDELAELCHEDKIEITASTALNANLNWDSMKMLYILDAIALMAGKSEVELDSVPKNVGELYRHYCLAVQEPEK
ncbi:MAG: GNAT family N-acetyltransferase [Acidimicrobiales bacterium]|nr:GNAT family N-acetyltransferase [Acidimicrobiales bacterium]